jgi:hypothetical protein
MAHTARVQKVIDEATELSPPELADLVDYLRRLPAMNDDASRGVRSGEDLAKLLASLRAGADFADDLEAVVREAQTQAIEPSPWER